MKLPGNKMMRLCPLCKQAIYYLESEKNAEITHKECAMKSTEKVRVQWLSLKK